VSFNANKAIGVFLCSRIYCDLNNLSTEVSEKIKTSVRAERKKTINKKVFGAQDTNGNFM
jgi:hypothetical protein